MSAQGVPAWGVCLPRGRVPCYLSHHAFDVTCMLPPHQLRPSNSAVAYKLLVGHVTCKACWDTPSPSPRGQIDTCENITLKRHKILLIQVVKMLIVVLVIFTVCSTPVSLLDFVHAMSAMVSKVPGIDQTKSGLRTFLSVLGQVNYCVNAFIYYWTS